MPEKKDYSDEKIFAAISYVWILFLVPLLAKKDSDFVLFHARQGFVFFVFTTLLGAVSWIPVLGWIIGFVGGIIAVILFVIGIVNAVSGKKEELPIIGHYAQKFNI